MSIAKLVAWLRETNIPEDLAVGVDAPTPRYANASVAARPGLRNRITRCAPAHARDWEVQSCLARVGIQSVTM
jgi:hypothetical protein